MTKPSQHNFSFDKSVAKDRPSIAGRLMDFVMPAVLAALGIAVGFVWFG
jgi:hypothetical protein